MQTASTISASLPAGAAAVLLFLSISLPVFSAASKSPPIAGRAFTVQVPDGMAARPFNKPRTLTIPPGFSIRVFARVSGARFLAVTPKGDLLVSQPGAGTITLLRKNDSGKPQQFTFASDLHNPHDMVFHKVRNDMYLYVAESNRIVRTKYVDGQSHVGEIETIVDNLPDASSPALKGSYGHQLKNIALHDDKLYVSIASTCNACESDTKSDPIRSAIYEYDTEGNNRRLYAQGLRNAEGLAFRPGTNELWAVVNNRDNIAYPFHKDWDGDGKDDYGKVVQSYVDGHPPDLLVKVKDGGNYGWPFCNSNPDNGLDSMPYDRDAQLNPDGKQLDCERIDRVTKGLTPHSAPLGMSFLRDSKMPQPYRNALVVALHGCWNCSKLNGHKIELYPVSENGSVGNAVDLVSGWVTDAEHRERWGRPVDVVPDGSGGLYISDDYSGTIYLLHPE